MYLPVLQNVLPHTGNIGFCGGFEVYTLQPWRKQLACMVILI